MGRDAGILACSVALALASVPSVSLGLDGQVFGHEEWLEAIEALGLDPDDVVYPFAANDEMAEWAKERVNPYFSAQPENRLRVLQQALFDKGHFAFDYEQTSTLTAPEAFAFRHGNCMSFTSLFIAMSRSLGLPAFLVGVDREPDVERDDDLVVVNRHVVAGFRAAGNLHLYDFYVSSVGPYSSRRVIDDLGASALYHTNIAGQEIRDGNYEEALRHLEIATTVQPDWAPAWVNLGVTRARLGDTDAAMEAYRQALLVEPGNSSALVNMASVYSEQGLEDEARTALRAAAEGSRNPFTLIAMADIEMLRDDFSSARKYLRRARWWYGREPEVYDALARLAESVGDSDRAEKHRERAAELRAKADGAAGDSTD